MTDEIDRVIWRQDLIREANVCRETIRRWIRAGKLPQPDVDITRQRQGWKRSTLVAAGIPIVGYVAPE